MRLNYDVSVNGNDFYLDHTSFSAVMTGADNPYPHRTCGTTSECSFLASDLQLIIVIIILKSWLHKNSCFLIGYYT